MNFDNGETTMSDKIAAMIKNKLGKMADMNTSYFISVRDIDGKIHRHEVDKGAYEMLYAEVTQDVDGQPVTFIVDGVLRGEVITEQTSAEESVEMLLRDFINLREEVEFLRNALRQQTMFRL